MSDTGSREQAVPWVPPALVQGTLPTGNNIAVTPGGADRSVPLDEHQRQLEQARKAGYQSGFEQGQTASHDSSNEQLELQSQLIQSLSQLTPQFDDKVMRGLLDFALTLSQLIIKREIKTDGEYYQALIRQISADYTQGQNSVSVTLHPDDIKLVQTCCVPDDNTNIPQLLENADLTRGSCLLDTGEYFVDFGVDAMINRVAATLDQQHIRLSSETP